MELTPTNDESGKLQPDQSSASISDTERWGSLITGGALVLLGLQQRSLRGALLAIAGSGLAYHGATSKKGLQTVVTEATGADQQVRLEKTVTIANKSPEELYRFWRNLENLPKFMKHLKSVQVLDATHSHWVAYAPLNQAMEWDAEIISDRENQLIAWTSAADADIDHSGFVRFQPAPAGRGTEVKVVMEYSPPAGKLGATVAKLFGKEPEQQAGDALRHLKMLMEAGEIATTEGQPAGHQ